MLYKNNIEITDNDIKYAEKVLLENGYKFDLERRDFIKNLDNIDLQAVPGSGKTTALLAKLLILERKMPFSDGAGILVLSHTNTAVDEIKERLGRIAPKLFKFPNFIGTIQSFVDEFLAKPYYISKIRNTIKFIDTDIRNKVINDKYFSFFGETSISIKNKIKHIKNTPKANDIIYNSILENINNNYDLYLNDTKITIKKPKGRTRLENYTDYTEEDKIQVYKGIINLRLNIIMAGYLSFEDAFLLGKRYIEIFPKIIQILQNRFKYVFVDEMQDMECHQVEILEKLFFKKYVFNHCFQRIGDKNQAIYGGEVKAESSWNQNNRKELKISGTHRLTQTNSKIVERFGLYKNEVKGKRILCETRGDIKPILLVYKTEHLNDENSGDNKIIGKFSNIIKEKKDDGYFDNVNKIICKSVIWSAKPHDSFDINKCRMQHYFNGYSSTQSKTKTKVFYNTYKDYLYYYDKNLASLKSRYNNILSLIVRILRDNNITKSDKFYTKTSLLKDIKEKNTDLYNEFKEKLYLWSRELSNSNINNISLDIESYLINIFSFLGLENPSIPIFEGENDKISFIPETSIEDELNNIYYNEQDGINIEIGTVHSVKGETHTCTLYLDSFMRGYESEKLIDSIRGDNHNFLIDNFSIRTGCSNKASAIKMMYVGLSRPTHLLCYAVHEDRFSELINGEGNRDKVEELWEIIYID